MGYYDEVSTHLKAGVSPSVSALDTGMKAAMAMGGLVDGAMEAALLPVLGAWPHLCCTTSPLTATVSPENINFVR